MSENTIERDTIERDLQQTRARMDNRLTELQARLSPGQVLDDVMDYFRGSEGADFTRNLMDSVRNNPLPAALTGIGLTWLMASNPRPQPQAPAVEKPAPAMPASNGDWAATAVPANPRWTSRTDFDRHISDAEQKVVRQSDEAEDAFRGRLVDARAMVLGVVRQAHDTLETFGKRVQDAWQSASDSLADGAHELRDWASEAAGHLLGKAPGANGQAPGVGRSPQPAGGNLLATITDNPMLLGAIGLALGALLGGIVPQADQEQAALGDIAGKARAAARDLAQEAVDRGGKVAQQVLDAGLDSTRAHGLTGDKTVGAFVDETLSGDLVSNVQQVAQDVLKAGDSAFRKDGLNGMGKGSDGGQAASPPPMGG